MARLPFDLRPVITLLRMHDATILFSQPAGLRRDTAAASGPARGSALGKAILSINVFLIASAMHELTIYRKMTAPRRCRFTSPFAPDLTAANAPRIASSPLEADPSTSPGRTGDGHDANATSMGLASPCNLPQTLVFSRSRTLFALFLQSQHFPLDTPLGCVKMTREKLVAGRW
jgi:hypothetical protein